MLNEKKIILDANVIIDLHTLGMWKKITETCQIVVSSIIKKEALFYRNEIGIKMPIDISKGIQQGKVQEISASLEQFAHIQEQFTEGFIDSIDLGEREAFAILYYKHRQDNLLFCTSDRFAIKCLAILGLERCGISVEELLEYTHLEDTLTQLYKTRFSKAAFRYMLELGSHEKMLYRKHFTLR